MDITPRPDTALTDSKPQSKINELLKFLQQYANEIEYLGMSTLSITIWRFHPLVPPSDRCLRSCRSCIRAVVGLGGRGSDCQLEEFLLFPSNFSIGVGLKIQSETRFFLSAGARKQCYFTLLFSSLRETDTRNLTLERLRVTLKTRFDGESTLRNNLRLKAHYQLCQQAQGTRRSFTNGKDSKSRIEEYLWSHKRFKRASFLFCVSCPSLFLTTNSTLRCMLSAFSVPIPIHNWEHDSARFCDHGFGLFLNRFDLLFFHFLLLLSSCEKIMKYPKRD